MIKYICNLSPVESGPWWPARQYVVEQAKKMDIRPGDIICRLGNFFCYGGLFWLSKFIAKVTKSKYSHAAMVLDVNDDILLADVTTTGLKRQFLVDWVDDIRGNDITILRYKGDQSVVNLAVENARSVLTIDPNYDPDFMDNNDGKNFYCVELVCWCYLRAGIMLCDEVPIRHLPGWNSFYNLFAKVHGVNIDKPVWCVGGQEIGLMSSKHLQEVGKITLSGMKKIKRSISFKGA